MRLGVGDLRASDFLDYPVEALERTRELNPDKSSLVERIGNTEHIPDRARLKYGSGGDLIDPQQTRHRTHCSEERPSLLLGVIFRF